MTRRPPPLRRLVLGVGVALLAVPNLSSCGFNYATNRVNTIEMGITDRSGQVDVLGAVIVSAQPGSGTLVTTLVNNDAAEPATLESLTGGPEGAIEVPAFDPIEIPAQGRVQLGVDPELEPGITVTGDFVPGPFLSVSLAYASGETSTLSIPVVPACRQWVDLDTSAADAEAGESEAAETEDAAAAEESEAGESGYYDCEPAAHSEE